MERNRMRFEMRVFIIPKFAGRLSAPSILVAARGSLAETQDKSAARGGERIPYYSAEPNWQGKSRPTDYRRCDSMRVREGVIFSGVRTGPLALRQIASPDFNRTRCGYGGPRRIYNTSDVKRPVHIGLQA